MTKLTRTFLGLAVLAITAAPAAANGPKTDKQAPKANPTATKKDTDTVDLGTLGGALYFMGVPPPPRLPSTWTVRTAA